MSVDPISAALAPLIRNALISRAASLARKGSYTEAENLLAAETGGKVEHPSVLDLLARIKAQQGKLFEAEELWTKASRMEPGNPEYQAGLRRISQIRKRGFSRRSLLTSTTAVCGVLVLLAAGIFLKIRFTESGVRNETVSGKVGGSYADGIPASATGVLQSIVLDIPGGIVTKRNSGFDITFEYGLFSSKVRLKGKAKKSIAALARRLEPYKERISITVIGHADSNPVPDGAYFRDNMSLSLARAVAVIESMRSAASLPSGIFLATGYGEYSPPYSNRTRNERLRNRSVTIKISAQGTNPTLP
ncbi:MAG: OmpA family protein [Deltaproteobacteria bacterium]|nr:OmpA family protein [Deltaproteobacteria bacterium]